jgi:hypothetical protein
MTKNKEREKKIKIIEITEEVELERLMTAKREYEDKQEELWRAWSEAVSIYNSKKHYCLRGFCSHHTTEGEPCNVTLEQADIELKEARKSYEKQLASLKRKRLKAINFFIAYMEWVRTKRVELKK